MIRYERGRSPLKGKGTVNETLGSVDRGRTVFKRNRRLLRQSAWFRYQKPVPDLHGVDRPGAQPTE